ncbi:MAG: oxidoreductase [Bradyrhizobium sp.]|nr:oxidoreductase [Bradyrhizobium sp.]
MSDRDVAPGGERMRAARAGALRPANSATEVIDLSRISRSQLETEPYRWAAVSGLYSTADAAALAATFPNDHFKRVADHAGEKKHEYQVRSLIRMSAQSISNERQLSSAWQALAHDFLSQAYRSAMSKLIGVDLSDAHLEVNVFHYPPGGIHGAHTDHRDKIVTHVLYFNESWNDDDGGCLLILKSSDVREIVTRISPLVGNSVVLVRSDDSWHAVSHVVPTCQLSRRSLTATFFHPGRVSTTVWPRWDQTLRSFAASRWQFLRGRLSGSTEASM